jgi:DNA-directed RNA polymerase subunit alpha
MATERQFYPILLRSVDALALTVLSPNSPRSENIHYVGDLVRRTEVDLLRSQHFGKKSLTEIQEVVDNHRLTLAMRLDA